jgi:hypothetical protein
MASFVEERTERAQILVMAHGMAADRAMIYHYLIGIPSVILSTLVGTAAFASITEAGRSVSWIAIVAGTFSAMAAVLTALQTFFNFPQRAEKHAEAAARFSRVVSRFERLGYGLSNDREIKQIDEEFAAIIKESPRASIFLQRRARKPLMRERFYPSPVGY